MRRRAWLGVAALVGLLALAGTWANHQDNSMNDTTSHHLPPMSTRCFARHLIDLPSEMELHGDVELYYGLDKNFTTLKVELLRSSGAQPAFKQLVAEQVLKLSSRETEDTPSKNFLVGQTRVDDDTVLIRAYGGLPGKFQILALAQRGAAIGLFSGDVYASTNDKPEAIEARVLDLVRRTSYAPDPAQVGQGTCLGPLSIDGRQDGEKFTLWAKPVGPNTDFVIEWTTNSMLAKGTDAGLLDRWDRNTSRLGKLTEPFKNLRRGKIAMGGRPAEEFGFEDMAHGVTVRSFAGETLVTHPSSFSEPRIHLEMRLGGQAPNGDYIGASLSKAESLALWDTIIKSIRLRPGVL